MRTLLLLLVLAVPATAAPLEEMQTCVEYLADDARGGRWPGSKGMKESQDYIREHCKALGLETYTQEVDTRGTTCINLIAVIPGHTDTRIVIGAHLDHIGKKWGKVYNGADDNASGCAVVLALATKLAKSKPGCTIEFHWYTGEEEGLTGSKVYVKRPLKAIGNYKFMLNLDMVGRLKTPTLLRGAFEFDDVLQPLYRKYPFASKITWAEDTGDSDHASWWRAGVPAVILHTGLHKDYHEPGDDAHKINYDGMMKAYRYALDIVEGVDRKLTPKPAEYTLR